MSFVDKINKELGRLKKDEEKGSSFSNVEWYAPKTGEQWVRILPNMKDPDDYPFVHVAIHFIDVEKKSGGKARVPARCLKDFDKECPLCKAYEKMASSKEGRERAKELKAGEKFLYNVIDYDNERVVPWAAGVTIHRSLCKYFGDFAQKAFNRDWKVEKLVEAGKPARFGTSYSIIPSLEESAIVKKFKPMLANVVDLETLYSEDKEEDMLRFLDSIGLGEKKPKSSSRRVVEDDEEDEAEYQKPKMKPKKRPVEDEDEDLVLEDYEDEDLDAKLAALGLK